MPNKMLLSQFSEEEIEQLKSEFKMLSGTKKGDTLEKQHKAFVLSLKPLVEEVNSSERYKVWDACLCIADYLLQNYVKRKTSLGVVRYCRSNNLPKEINDRYVNVVMQICDFIVNFKEQQRRR